MKDSLKWDMKKQKDKAKVNDAVDLNERIPLVMKEKEFRNYIKKKLQKWIEEVRKLSKEE